LLHNTNLPTQTDIDKAWSKEVDARAESLKNGNAKLIPGEEVFAKIKSGTGVPLSKEPAARRT
jgi:hypothetical protein